MKRLLLCIAAAWALYAPASSLAVDDLVLAVNEGTSGGTDHAQLVAKYKGVADAIGAALKRQVNVVPSREFSLLESGMRNGRFDFVMARPSDYPARGMRDYGYRFVASAKPDGQCFIVVPKNSTLKSLDDIKGKRLVMPEQVAYMSRFCTAELRDKGIDVSKERVQYMREQAAVGFVLENGLGDVGAVASYSGVAKKWEKDGHRVLHKSSAQPYFPLIAHNRITPEQVKAVQQALAALADTPQGKEVLDKTGLKGFDVSSEERLRKLLGWLGV
jgi:phosphonate transport system substrate-binding protein